MSTVATMAIATMADINMERISMGRLLTNASGFDGACQRFVLVAL
jgi:hypothetical protein